MLLKLALNKSHSKPCSVNGNVDLLQKIGKSADVILMSVGDNNTPDLVPVFLKIGEIGNNKINSEHISLGESKTAVHDHDIIFKFIDRDVLADLVQAAEEADLDGFYVFLPVLFRV